MGLTLRIYSGMHSGARMGLADGEYILGSSESCDVILADAGVVGQHLRLRIEKDSAFLLVYDGADATLDGAEIGAEEIPVGHFQEIRLGGCMFMLGPENGEWPAPRQEPIVAEAAPAAAATTDGKPQPAAAAASAKPGTRRFRKPRAWLIPAALLLIAGVFLARLWIPSAERQRLQTATALLENRGYTVTEDKTAAAPNILTIEPEGDGVVIAGAVDYARQVTQLESLLAENAIPAKLRLVARDDSLRRAESWLRERDIPLEVRVVGKSRAVVAGYAQSGEPLEAVDEVKKLLAGFDTVAAEIVSWPAMRTALEEILSKRGLAFLELSPAPFHVVVTGVLDTPESQKAWRDSEMEIQGRFRFRPRFVWMRPAEEYLRLARIALSERGIEVLAALKDRKTIRLTGFVKDEAVAARAAEAIRPLIGEWPGGTLETDFTLWKDAEGVLAAALADNGLKDVEIQDVGNYQVILMGDIGTPERTEAWQRVATSLKSSLRGVPAFVWRQPPPPEDSWLTDAEARLAAKGFAFAVAPAAGAANPAQLNLIKEKGRILLTGAVDTVAEKRALQLLSDESGYRFDIEVKSRDEVIRQVERTLSDRGAHVTFERLAGNRLLLRGYVGDVEAGRALFAELRGMLTAFAEVEENFVNWALIKDEFLAFVKARGLERLRIKPGPTSIAVEGELDSDDKRAAWDEASRFLDEKVRAKVEFAWKAPPPPSEATPDDVLLRLQDMGLFAVLVEEGGAVPPLSLAVIPDRKRIRVTGVVESIEEKRKIQALFDEGMRHLSVEVRSREEMLKRADRFLAEMEIGVALERLGPNNIMVRGYALDIAAATGLKNELAKILDGFTEIEEDIVHWPALRPLLSDALKGSVLEKVVVYPGEFEILMIGTLATDEEKEAWESIQAAADEAVGAAVTFAWHESPPPARPRRFGPRNAAGETGPILGQADQAIDHQGSIKAIAAAKEAEASPKANWQMRLLEVQMQPERRFRIDGNDKWFREGEMLQGYMVVEVFPTGAALVRGDNIVIYTLDLSEPTEEEAKKAEAAKKPEAAKKIEAAKKPEEAKKPGNGPGSLRP